MLLFILQEVATDQNNWYYIAQFIPILSTLAGILAMVAGVWSKRASDKNACTLKILVEKLDEAMKNRQVDSDLVKQLKAQIDTLVSVAPVIAAATPTATEGEK